MVLMSFEFFDNRVTVLFLRVANKVSCSNKK
jgi:hypothetical protein